MKGNRSKNVVIGAIVAFSLAAVSYYSFGSKQKIETPPNDTPIAQSTIQQKSETDQAQPNQIDNAGDDKQIADEQTSITTGENKGVSEEAIKNSSQPNSIHDTNSDNKQPGDAPSSTAANENEGITGESIKILKSEVTAIAKFYPLTLDGVNMEVIAVKATDGTIRTALNTCQVCFDSGRGYFIQEGDYLVCQNCGNRFHIDQVEITKGGCNPVPILETGKSDNGDSIIITAAYMENQKHYFSRWKTS